MTDSRERSWLMDRLPFPVYPIAVIVLLVIHLWAVSGVSPFAVVRSLIVAGLIGVGLAAAGTAILRDRHRGGLLGLAMVMALIAGGRLVVVGIMLVPAVLLVLERYGPWRVALNWPWIGRLVSRGIAIFALAILIEIIQLGRIGDLITAVQREGPFRAPPSAAAPADAPDVYVLLLDGYARSDILKERFAFDDSAFLDGLRQRGFDVASGSHSNYLVTNLSLPSFLNRNQLSDVPAMQSQLNDPTGDPGPAVFRAASEPLVLGDFRALGYETIAVSSGFEQVAVRGADRFIDEGEVNEFEVQFMRLSLVTPVASLLAPDLFSEQQRRRIESDFSIVEGLAAASSDRPRFIFAHVPSPHAPWVMKADGSPRTAANFDSWYSDTPDTTGLSRDEVVTGYRDQSAYLGGRTLAAIDAVLAASPKPPVILVLSDHGSSLDVSTANPETRLRNLFAAYTPGHPGTYAADASLVNVFPTLLNAYFQTGLPKAADTLFTQGPRGLFDPVQISTTSSQP
jgi:hypothetical protein